MPWSENRHEPLGPRRAPDRASSVTFTEVTDLLGVAALHNYLASILTASWRQSRTAIPVSAQVSDVQTGRRPAPCKES